MKKISRRRFLQITGISAAAVGLNACGGSSGSTAGTAASGSASAAPAADGKKYTLRASSNQAATSTIGMALAKFVELVNEKSAGRIKATANYGSELGSQAEQVAMAIAGDLAPARVHTTVWSRCRCSSSPSCLRITISTAVC